MKLPPPLPPPAPKPKPKVKAKAKAGLSQPVVVEEKPKSAVALKEELRTLPYICHNNFLTFLCSVNSGVNDSIVNSIYVCLREALR